MGDAIDKLLVSANKVCYRHIGQEKSWTLQAYQAMGGYRVWRDIVKNRPDPKALCNKIKQSLLKGRGGAGFLTGLKMSFIGSESPHPRFLVCNSDEGEPGTCKDGRILLENPHQLLEGMLISCYCQGMNWGFNYLRGEFYDHYLRVEAALGEAMEATLCGESILGTDITIHLRNVLGAGSYIVGEETAMLNSLEGKRGLPRIKPPFPAQHGLYGMPTTVNNTETIASLPVILEKGEDWFASMGKGDSGGFKIFCISGHVQRPGVFELPLGTSFADMLKLVGGLRPGRRLKAVIPGGSSMKILPADTMMALTMDYQAIAEAGSALGSGGVIVMDDSTCMVETLHNIMAFYKHESCGQCTPCREGTGWIFQVLHRILHGDGKQDDIDKLVTIAKNVEGRTICAFGEAFAWPVGSFIMHFRDEFDYFVANGVSKITGKKGGVWGYV